MVDLQVLWDNAIAAKRDRDVIDADESCSVAVFMYACGRLEQAVTTLCQVTGGSRRSIMAGIQLAQEIAS